MLLATHGGRVRGSGLNLSAYGSGTWVVPAGITRITVSARGAAGGATSTSLAGRGCIVETTITVTPGETLYYTVGQVGQIHAALGSNGSAQTTGPVAFPNGGPAGAGDFNTPYGGGGMTSLFRGGAWDAGGTPILIAPGGGGGGTTKGGDGGSSGSDGVEVTGGTHASKDGSTQGRGATPSVVGAAGHQSTFYGTGNTQPTAGLTYASPAGSGGLVTPRNSATFARAGGPGGGGGYKGGGGAGGDAEGGLSSSAGGGSAYVDGTATGTTYAVGAYYGDGALVVTPA